MHLLRGRGVTLGYLGGALVVVGVVAAAAFYVINVVTLEMTDPAAEPEQMAALVERIEEGTAATILLVVFSAGTGSRRPAGRRRAGPPTGRADLEPDCPRTGRGGGLPPR
jgi:predicted outer membrane lipoprotein